MKKFLIAVILVLTGCGQAPSPDKAACAVQFSQWQTKIDQVTVNTSTYNDVKGLLTAPLVDTVGSEGKFLQYAVSDNGESNHFPFCGGYNVYFDSNDVVSKVEKHEDYKLN